MIYLEDNLYPNGLREVDIIELDNGVIKIIEL